MVLLAVDFSVDLVVTCLEGKVSRGRGWRIERKGLGEERISFLFNVETDGLSIR